jgi:hypothetical protein
MTSLSLVRELLHFFPSVYGSREQVLLDALLYGDYQWVDGELVAEPGYFAECERRHPHRTDANAEFLAMIDEWIENALDADGRFDERFLMGELTTSKAQAWRKSAAARTRRTAFVRENLSVIARGELTVPGTALRDANPCIAPAHHGCPLDRLPDDTHDGWLDAAQQIAEHVIAIEGRSVYASGPDDCLWEAEKRARESHMKLVRRALTRISTIRSGR